MGSGPQTPALLDDLANLAWPATESTRIDRWLVRSAGGVTKRANSVLPNGEPADLGAAIRDVEGYYRGRGLPPCFQLSPAARPARLDAVLDQRGYRLVEPTIILTAPVDDAIEALADAPACGATTLPVAVAAELPAPWLGSWWCYDGRADLSGAIPAQMDIARRILTGVPAGYALAGQRHRPLGVGRAVVYAGWVNLSCLAVDPCRRGEGIGRTIVGRLLAWSRNRGAEQAYLQVVESNEQARRLYRAAGFVPTSRYHYRVATTS